jgi:hypothetical protein
MATIQLRRDPFRRSTLMREQVYPAAPCLFCGQDGRFVYFWADDRVYTPGHSEQAGPFCTVGCWEAFIE